MTVKTDFNTYDDCYLVTDRYVADGSLAIRIAFNETREFIAIITKCLLNYTLKSNMAYIGTNNCPWAEKFIEEYHLGKPTGKTKKSGYCEYPLYEFDLKEIRKYESNHRR